MFLEKNAKHIFDILECVGAWKNRDLGALFKKAFKEKKAKNFIWHMEVPLGKIHGF